jgi:hypothetical protein
MCDPYQSTTRLVFRVPIGQQNVFDKLGLGRPGVAPEGMASAAQILGYKVFGATLNDGMRVPEGAPYPLQENTFQKSYGFADRRTQEVWSRTFVSSRPDTGFVTYEFTFQKDAEPTDNNGGVRNTKRRM